jgi:transcriptional regulator with XRE-family HTH domain
MDLPELLRTQRARRRLSQERAALALGVTFYRYRRFEEARSLPTADEVAAIAQLFALTPRAVRAAISATVVPGPGNGEAASVA